MTVSVYSQMLIFNSNTQTGPGEMFEVSNSATILFILFNQLGKSVFLGSGIGKIT